LFYRKIIRIASSIAGDASLGYGRSMKKKVSKKITVKTAPSSISSFESIFQVWGWILLVWSLYRYFFQFPEYVDEFFFKPLIFVVPILFYVLKKEKRNLESIGITGKNLFPSIYIGIGFGIIFALEGIMVNIMKNGKLMINPIDAFRQYGLVTVLIMSLATATWEEILNRGFIFSRLYEISKNLLYAAFIGAILFVLLHVPILITTLKFKGSTLGLYFLTNIMLGIINSILFARHKSIVAPILVHLFWNMTVALYL
jgi:membrane protease YdiL (CAAX protease family)